MVRRSLVAELTSQMGLLSLDQNRTGIHNFLSNCQQLFYHYSPMFRSDPGYVDNHERMSALVTELKGKVGAITQGGGEKSVERHTSRSKQLLYSGFPFLQFSQPVVYRL